MARTLGEAIVVVRGDGSGLTGDVEKQASPGASKTGSRLGSLIGGALKRSAVVVGAGMAGVLGVALAKGFSRLSAIENAKASLAGLGHSTASITKIMENALGAVRGTAFGLDEAASVAASAVAAGIKPGQQLERTLKLVADAATIGKTSMGEMGGIFNKVATSNKVQGDVINQLNDRGIPIVQMLGKSMGKTSEEVLKLSQQGKIGFAEFSAAMQSGLGGAALKSGNTFTGAWKNMMASISRIGAGLLSGIFPSLAPGISGITAALAPLEGKAAQVGAVIGKVLAPAIEKIGPFITRMVNGLLAVDFTKMGSGSSTLAKAFRDIGAAIAGIDWSQLRTAFGQGVGDTAKVFAVVIGFLADHLDTLARILPGLVVAFAAYKTAQAASQVISIAQLPITAAQVVANLALARANGQLAAQMAITNGAENVSMLTRARTTIATIAKTVAEKAAAVASKAMAAGQWLLNAAMSANPIALVVIAIAALVAGLIYAYKHSETFRNIVNAAFTMVKNVVGAVVGWFGKWVPAVFGAVVGLVKGYINVYRTVIVTAFNVVKTVITTVMNAIKSVVGGIWKGVTNLISSGATTIVNAVKGIPGKIGALATSFGNVGKKLIGAFVNGLKNASGIISGIAGNVWNAVRSLLNGAIGKINAALEFRIDKGPVHLSINPPDIPRLWTGARATRPTLAMIGDGREPESVMPDGMLERALARAAVEGSKSGGDGPVGGVHIEVHDKSGDPRQTGVEVARQFAFAGVR